MGLFGSIGSAIGGIASGIGSIVGANNSSASAEAINQANYEHQKEFAQNGIRWKVADAKAAGLHPLAALGAQTAGYTPSAVVGDSPDFSFLRDIGQDVGRAIDAKSTAAERAENKAKIDQGTNLELEGKSLDNEYKRALIKGETQDQALKLANAAVRASWSQQLPPAMPSIGRDGRVVDGQGDSTSSGSITKNKPAEIVMNDPATPAAEAGSNPEIRYFRTSDGGYSIARSESYADSTDDDLAGQLSWELRNRLPATAWDSSSAAPPPSYLPDGGRGGWAWSYNPLRQAYYPYRKGDWKSRTKARFLGN
jgi:hypothetical protein